MNMLQEVHQLMTLLGERFPIKEHCHHALMINDDKITIQLALDSGFTLINIEPEEFELASVDEVLVEIIVAYETRNC